MNGNACKYLILIVSVSIGRLGVATDEYHQRIDTAVDRSIKLVEKSAHEYLNHRECFSCHHQSLPILALSTAKRRGYQIDQDKFDAQIKHVSKHFKKNEEKYREGKGTGGQVDTAGYGLWALNQGNIERQPWTDAVVEYLLKRDQKRNYWRRSSERPPSEASNFTATYVAFLALKNYGHEKLQKASV